MCAIKTHVIGLPAQLQRLIRVRELVAEAEHVVSEDDPVAPKLRALIQRIDEELDGMDGDP